MKYFLRFSVILLNKNDLNKNSINKYKIVNMVNYQLGKIYKLVDNTNGNIYVGSTCEPNLSRRLATHVGVYKRYLVNKHHFASSFTILVNNCYEMILLENYPCNSKDELYARERYYIESLQCVNKQIPTRTKKEWQDDHKEYIKAHKADYYKTNQELIAQRGKEYYLNNCEYIKERVKTYQINNAETVRERSKQYRLDNADDIKEKKNKRCICLCGATFTCANKNKHLQTQKHIKAMMEI